MNTNKHETIGALLAMQEKIRRGAPKAMRTVKAMLLSALVAATALSNFGCNNILTQMEAQWEDVSPVEFSLEVPDTATQNVHSWYQKNDTVGGKDGKPFFPNGRIQAEIKWKDEYRNKLDGASLTISGNPAHLSDANITVQIVGKTGNPEMEISWSDYGDFQELVRDEVSKHSSRYPSVDIKKLNLVSGYTAFIRKAKAVFLAATHEIGARS
ncbi:MAG: hypothetical protein LBI17_00005 [Rickettsiales bacterium]|jgi:hypothetical protein|nr:hypothetical protein [Rickettsiales bacterium]